MKLISIRNFFKNHEKEQETDSFRIFQVPIGNAKVVLSFVFHEDAPILSYRQKSLNSCCYSSLASDFASINHFKAAADISLRIKEPLKSEVGNLIHFATDITKKNKKNKVETKVHYSLMKYKKKGEYDILENISANRKARL